MKGPPVVGEPPCGTIVEQRMRGRIGDPVHHLMKGDSSGKQLQTTSLSLRTAEALRTASLYVHKQSHIEGTHALTDPPPIAGSQWSVLKCHPGADLGLSSHRQAEPSKRDRQALAALAAYIPSFLMNVSQSGCTQREGK